MDIDIDMDLDIDCVEDLPHQEFNSIRNQEIDISSYQAQVKPILDIPNDTSGPNFLDPVPNKIHLRGLENLTTNDIYAYAAKYFNSHKPSHIEWIDDSSANLVFPSPDIALDALKSLAASEVVDIKGVPVLQTIKAKSFTLHPDTNLEIRLAVVGDKKKVGARERSRFYLFNPEYDPTLCNKRTNLKTTKNNKHKIEEGHRVLKYDNREQQRRERKTEFDSKLYDDTEMPILNQLRSGRRGRRRDGSLIPETKDKDLRLVSSHKIGIELFPDHEDHCGRLRDRSASPVRDNNDVWKETSKRFKIQMSKENYENNGKRELFPQTQSMQRFGNFDSKDHSGDLFPQSPVVSLLKGSEYLQQSNNKAFSLRVMRKNGDITSGISIRGLAKDLSTSTQGFAIKGASSGVRAKELFPSSLSDNVGKELFDRNLEDRLHRRKMAKDLFHS